MTLMTAPTGKNPEWAKQIERSKMDFSAKGLKEGAIKALKVLGYVVASSVVAGLIAELAKYHPDESQLWAVAGVAVANAILVGAKTWLETKK